MPTSDKFRENAVKYANLPQTTARMPTSDEFRENAVKYTIMSQTIINYITPVEVLTIAHKIVPETNKIGTKTMTKQNRGSAVSHCLRYGQVLRETIAHKTVPEQNKIRTKNIGMKVIGLID